MSHREETQKVEFKSIWKDDYLKQICGFTNSHGGVIYIGINDQGEVIGIKNANRLLEEIPNKAANLMGIILQVDLLYENKLPLFISCRTRKFPSGEFKRKILCEKRNYHSGDERHSSL